MADRFVVIHKESTLNTSTQVIVDTATGVCYLWHRDGYGGGLTPCSVRTASLLSPIYPSKLFSPPVNGGENLITVGNTE